MAEWTRAEMVSHKGKRGFKATIELEAVSKGAAQFRAVGSTAMRFPTTITSVDTISTRRTEMNRLSDVYEVDVFIPTEGFSDAGISNPLQWVREQFEME